MFSAINSIIQRTAERIKLLHSTLWIAMGAIDLSTTKNYFLFYKLLYKKKRIFIKNNLAETHFHSESESTTKDCLSKKKMKIKKKESEMHLGC